MKPLLLGALMATALIALDATSVARADQVVQIPIDTLLNGRPVSTFTGGTIVPWTAGQGVDNGGCCDGLATAAVLAQQKAQNVPNANGNALPDDGVFAATARLPQIALHFSNSAPATAFQTRYVKGLGTFSFTVPAATYSKMFLLLTASEANVNLCALTITLTYSDGSTVMMPYKLPDYGIGGATNPSDPVYFNLIAGMHKWNAQDQPTDVLTHTITGIELNPAPAKILNAIQVDKTSAPQYLVFWGATGIATSAVDAGIPLTMDSGGGSGSTSAPGDASTGSSGGASSGSAAGTGSASGSSTSGSSSGTGGASGAAGTGASTGSMAAGSGASSGSAGASSGTGFGSSPTSGGCACSFSSAPSSGLTIVGSLAALCGVLRRRRQST